MNRSLHRHRPVRSRLVVSVIGTLLTSSVSLTGAVPAEELRLDHVERITANDRLAHGSIWDVEQDSRGFLWFATTDALVRYDGYEARVYRHDAKDPGSLPAGLVRRVHEDRQGVLWSLTEAGGLSRFDRASESFVTVLLSESRLSALAEDSSGSLWIGGVEGLHFIDRGAGDTVTTYRYDGDDPDSLSAGAVSALLVDRQGVVWVGTEDGLDRFDPQSDRFVHHRHDPAAPESLSHNFVRAILEDRQGRLWIGTEGGLDQLDRETGTFVRHHYDATLPPGPSPDLVWAIHEDHAGGLWIGTENGGLLYRPVGADRCRRYRHDPATSSGLISNSILDVYEDRTGVLWLASRAGVSKIDRRRELFTTLRRRPDAGGLMGDTVMGVAEDASGKLWVSTRNGGVSVVDRAAGSAVHYGPHDPEAGIPAAVSSLIKDRDGQIWIGTDGLGLSRVDPLQRSFVHYRNEPGNPKSLHSDRIYGLLSDRIGSLWVATRSTGIQRIEFPRGSGERFVTYRHDRDDPDSVSSDEVYGFFEDREGELWILSTAGLNRFDRESETFEKWRSDRDDPDSLSSNDVTSMAYDGHGVYWIGTYGGGLNRWDRERGEFRHFREGQGLASDTVVSLLAAGDSHLWLATKRGLSRFDPATETFRNYDAADGIHGNVFYVGARFTSPSGEMFFGGLDGLTAFFPERIVDDPHAPEVVLTQLRLAGQPAELRSQDPGSPLIESITEGRRLELDHRHKAVAFEFAALHFANPQRNRYAYRLEGFDDDWIETDAGQRLAQYTNLDPGGYVFRVKASNKDGVWNDQGASIRLRVLAPPWQTWWAYSLYVSAFVALVAAFLRAQRTKLRREQDAAERERRINARLREGDRLKDELLEEREQLVSQLESRNAELARLNYTISHDLRAPLVTIKNFVGLLRRDAEAGRAEHFGHHLDRLDHAADHLHRLLEELFELSKIETARKGAWGQVAFAEVVRAVAGELAELLAGRHIELDVAPELPVVTGDRKQLRQLTRHLLENAVKHIGDTSQPRIEVGAKVSGDQVLFFVSDNGPGIDPRYHDRVFDLFERLDPDAVEGTGLGLALVKRIAEAHGGRAWVESEGRGSRFCVTLSGAC